MVCFKTHLRCVNLHTCFYSDLGRILGFFQHFIFSKTLMEMIRKHVFTASNKNTIKNRVERRNENKCCENVTVSFFNLSFALLICINY